jgi:hypothetical protein
MPLEQFKSYSAADVLRLSKAAEEMFNGFSSASLSLDQAFRQYLEAARLWNLAGAPVAITLQTHLEQLSLADDTRKEVEAAIQHLDLRFARDRQRAIAFQGFALAQGVATGVLVS